MGKSTIITYSATGNSLEVAKLLDGDVVFLNETAEIPEETEILGFVFPTYAFSLPYPVRTFIREKVKARDNSDIKYVYSIITCAGLPGFVKSDLEKELADAGLALSYVKTVKMPDAYLPLKKKAFCFLYTSSIELMILFLQFYTIVSIKKHCNDFFSIFSFRSYEESTNYKKI